MLNQFKTTRVSVLFVKKKEDLLPLLLVLTVSAYLLFYILPTNVNGDGAMHAFLTRKMVESGGLLDHIPFAVDRVGSGKLTYEPIFYPETVYVAWSIFYTLGGEQLLKFSSVFFGVMSALTVFLLLRDVNWYVAFFAGFGIVVVNTLRFIMTPLIEQVFLFAALSAILFYYRSLKTRKLRYFLLAGVFLGLSVAIKQQGLVLFGVIFLHILLTMGYAMVRRRKAREVAPFLIILGFSVLVGAAPLYEQFMRTGTIAPSGSLEFLPFYSLFEKFVKPKVPIDRQADLILSEMLATEEVRMGMGLDNVAQQYLLTPFLYSRSSLHYGINMSVLFFLLSIPLYLGGGWFLAKKYQQLLLLLISVLFVEFLSTLLWNAEVYKYNVLGLSIMAIFLVAGIYQAKNLILGNLKGRMPALPSQTLSVLFVLLVLAIMIAGNFIFAFKPYWRDEGRQTDVYIDAYGKLKDFIDQSDIPKAALFLAPQGNFLFICERDALWISSYGGAMVPTIFATENQTEALHWLRSYNISFIVIDTKQTQRKGLYDYIPEHGLMDYINNSPFFEEIFSYPSQDELLVLYKVIFTEG